MKKIVITITLCSILFSCKNRNHDVDASGTFEATEVIVSSEANGKLLRFDVEEGQRVKMGEKLGIVDTVQLYLKKVQLQTSARSVDSRKMDIAKQIAATQEQIATQLRERDRVEKLLAANAANRKQLDDINSAIAVLEKQLIAQKSSMENSNRSISEESSSVEVQIAQIMDQLTKSIITSPIDGTVLVKYAEQGEVTAVGKPLFKVADIDHIYLRAYVDASQLVKIKIGQKATVYVDYGGKEPRSYEGRVTWISNQAEFTPKTIQTRDERANLTTAVKIAVENDGLIKIGMYGDVKFND